MSRKDILYHLAAWTVFIAYEVSTIYFLIGKVSAVMDYVPHYVMNITLFYVNLQLIKSERWRPKVVWMITVLFSYIFLNYWLNTFLEACAIKVNHPVNSIRNFVVSSFYRGVYFIGLSTMYGFALNLLRSRDRINGLLAEKFRKENIQVSLERDLLTTQNALLRAQINPHLFFNTLSFIYNSVHKLSQPAGEAVMLLADITRYSISKADRDGLVYLQDELANIKDLISLNQLRFSERLQIRFECDLEAGNMKIIPLALLTLVENVIKYADLHDARQPAMIKVSLGEDYLHFATRNKKINNIHQFKGNGLGLSNTRMRLMRAYGLQYQLRVNETEELFFVDLTIPNGCLCLAAIS